MSKAGKRRPPIGAPKEVPSVGPLDIAYERCEAFASNMLASFFLYNLPTVLETYDEDDPYQQLEVKLAIQIVLDSLDDSGVSN